MKDDETKDRVAVATLSGYGTFSWQEIQDIVKIHHTKNTRTDIMKEEVWFNQLFSELSRKGYARILEDVRSFRSVLWNSDEGEQVLNTSLPVERLCNIACGRWLSDDIIDCIFKMLNRDTSEHYFAVLSEPLLHSAKAREKLTEEIDRKARNGLRYLHFALNVVQSSDGKVTVQKGDHWTYFVFNASD